MSVFKRTIPGKSPAHRIAAERWQKAEKNQNYRQNNSILNFKKTTVDKLRPTEKIQAFN